LPTGYYSRPTMFSLPVSNSSSTSSAEDTKTLVIAYRDFMLPSTLTELADVGGFHNAPILGDTTTVRAGYTMSWLELVRSYAVGATLIPIFAVIAVMAFTLILFDRSDKVYQLVGWLFLLQAASQVFNSASTWTQVMTITTSQLLNDGLMTALIYTGWVIVWWVWFGRQRPSWTPWAAGGLGLLFFITLIVGQEVIVGLVPHRVASAFLSALVVVRLLFLALQLMIVFRGIRRQGLESWLVLPAVLLWSVNSFSTELALLHIPIRWEFLGLSIRLATVSSLLLVIVVAVLLLRRLQTSIQTQRQMALDVKQAQEVQQMILPEALTMLPGLVIESEYIPACEVGGDFFQTIPNPADTSLLIVAGDVTGKGLQAGMLVALLVGAIRTAASHNSDPRYVLGELNARLLGRKNAQATCLALRIDADGAVTIANAGHMAPYLNGELVHIEGSLPLGMLNTPEFTLMRFKLRENDKLILISDGVVEAMDEEGRLYGFERVHQLLQSPVSAAQVAYSAQAFGQQDDITVISVTCTGVAEPALA
jgi:sulfur transfer complex TusBCD TusB component (DsrH family)